MAYVIVAIITILITLGISYFIFRKLPQDKIYEINQELIESERQQLQELICEKEVALVRYNNVKNSLNDLEEQASKSAEIFYKQKLELAEEQLDRALEQAGARYQAEEEAYRNEYLETLREFSEWWQKEMDSCQEQTLTARATLQDLQQKVDSAVEASKRAEELRQSVDFYRLQLSDLDLKEIEMLRNVTPYLRDKEPLNKVIWKVYYEKPTTDLIGRVVGSGTKTGIYKITNIENNMCYVGQAVNIADRWKQHIKRGIGADAPTRNKLYPAMIALGVENFTFEVLEVCDRDLLNAREDYWQDFYHAKDFGYSIK